MINSCVCLLIDNEIGQWASENFWSYCEKDLSCGIKKTIFLHKQQVILHTQDSAILPTLVANHSAWFGSFYPTWSQQFNKLKY